MDTPGERLAALVAQAERVIERTNDAPGSATFETLALSLAHAVIKHGKAEAKPAPPERFSFAIESEPEPTEA